MTRWKLGNRKEKAREGGEGKCGQRPPPQGWDWAASGPRKEVEGDSLVDGVAGVPGWQDVLETPHPTRVESRPPHVAILSAGGGGPGHGRPFTARRLEAGAGDTEAGVTAHTGLNTEAQGPSRKEASSAHSVFPAASTELCANWQRQTILAPPSSTFTQSS